MSPGNANRSLRRNILSWGILAVICTALTAYAVSYPLNHDVGWWLYIARSMLEGEGLYTSLIEINPPLYGYLAMIPASIARGFAWPIEPTAEFSVLLVVIIAVLSATRLATVRVDPGLRFVVAAALLLALLAMPGVDYGQREHLMLALTTPYAILIWRRIEGMRVNTAVGVWAGVAAGVGFAVKPHFVVVWIALEFYYLIRRRSLRDTVARPEFFVVILVLGAYALFVILVFPEYLALLSEARETYSDFNAQSRWQLASRSPMIVLAAVTLAAMRTRGQAASLGRVFVVIAAATWFLGVVQAKGWTYHFYPVFACATAAAVLMGYSFFLDTRNRMRRMRSADIGVIVLLLVTVISADLATFVLHQSIRTFRNEVMQETLPYVARYGSPEGTLLVLSDAVPDAFPLVNRSGMRWGSPFPSLWWIRAVYGGSTVSSPEDSWGEQGRLQGIEVSYLRRLTSRIAETEPQLVLVDTATLSRFGGRVFPYVDYLRRDSTFARQWESYARLGAVDRFQVWARTGSGRTSPHRRR